METSMLKWICSRCGWIYNPEIGTSEGGVLAQTPFEFIPCDWRCPSCGGWKTVFEPVIDVELQMPEMK